MRSLAVTSDWDAATYDRIADPMYRWGLAVVEWLGLEGRERVLDAGCGSGRVTEVLLERLPQGSVVALDASSAMLEEARRRLSRFGQRVEYVRADLAEPLPVQGSVDAVLSTATFHWIRDHDALFRNLAACLRPGGRLAAQCGAAGNIQRVLRAAALAGLDPRGPTYFLSYARRNPLAPGGCGLRRRRSLDEGGTDPHRSRRASRDVPSHGLPPGPFGAGPGRRAAP